MLSSFGEVDDLVVASNESFCSVGKFVLVVVVVVVIVLVAVVVLVVVVVVFLKFSGNSKFA